MTKPTKGNHPKIVNGALCDRTIEVFNRFRKKSTRTGEWDWQGVDSRFYMELLVGAFQPSNGVPEHITRQILRKALSEANQVGPISTQALLASFSREEKSFLKKPYEKFVVVTSISTGNDWLLPRRRIGHNTISFHKTVPKPYTHAEHHKERAWPHRLQTPPKGYTAVLIHTRGRDVVEAYESAMDSLNLLRGIWNLLLNLQFPRERLTKQTEPLNEIRGGPIHTIHHPNGEAASPGYWYEPIFQERSIRVFDVKAVWKEMISGERLIRQKLRCVSNDSALKQVLRDYARILDSVDLDGAYLEMWRLLEKLTLKEGEQGSKDKIPRRVSFLYDEPDFVREVVRFLNMYRDKAVHHGYANKRVYILLQRLRDYVDALVRFHLEQAAPERTIDDAIDLLCLSPSNDQLRKEIDLRRRALRFRQV